jgi:NifB/MoaA-like Fe-S oxidoreductase
MRTVGVANTLYGPAVTAAGLLGGKDHLTALRALDGVDLAIFSRAALNDDELFLDDIALEELHRELPHLRICASEHVTDVLIA